MPRRLHDKLANARACPSGRMATLVALMMLAATGVAAAQTAPYQIAPGDTLQITAYGDAGLSGRFAVSPEGAIAYPLVGSIKVAGLTPEEVEAEIDKAISRRLAGRTVTVALSGYAPVFILGDVEKPGRYEFHPGMIALELLALGGGQRRSANVMQDIQVELVAARQEYADLALQQFSSKVTYARLEAETNGGGFAYPLDPATADADRQSRQRIVDAEADLFKVRKANLAAQKAALENQRQSYLEEIAALEGRAKLHEDEVKLLEQDVAAADALVGKGLTSRSNLREAQRQLSAARRDGLELGSYLARARQGALAILQRESDLTQARRAENAAALRELDIDMPRRQKQMSAIVERIAAIGDHAESALAREAKTRLGYAIVRSGGGRFAEVKADELTVIRPGDIMRVVTVLPDRLGSAAVRRRSVAGGGLAGAAALVDPAQASQ